MDDGCDGKGEEREESNIKKDNRFQISPNPTRDDLELIYEFEVIGDYQVAIYDLIGKQLTSFGIKKQSGQLRISTDTFESGLYFFSIMESLAQFESALISERVKAGMASGFLVHD